MDDNCAEWVESMRVVSGRGYQEAGVARGWNLWVWLECIGVVSGFVVRSLVDFLIIILLIPIPLVLALFFVTASLYTSLFI